MAALRPLAKPKIVKKRTKKVIGARQTDRSKLSRTGGNAETLTTGCAEEAGPDLDAQCRLWELQENKTRAASGFQQFLVHSVRELVLRLLPASANVERAAQLAIRSPTPMPGCAAKK